MEATALRLCKFRRCQLCAWTLSRNCTSARNKNYVPSSHFDFEEYNKIRA